MQWPSNRVALEPHDGLRGQGGVLGDEKIVRFLIRCELA